MIYSCFNEKLGQYEHFQDDRGHPVNGDLPVPSLPSDAGRTGVPAREAGRRLPSDARRIGTGWHAQGMVVQCRNLEVPGLSGDGSSSGLLKLGGLALLAGGILGLVLFGDQILVGLRGDRPVARRRRRRL